MSESEINMWKKVISLTSGVEASGKTQTTTMNNLELWSYDNYVRNVPIVRDNKKEDLNLAVLGITFPKTSISEEQLLEGMGKHNVHRFCKEVKAEIKNVITPAFKSCLTQDLSIPSGKNKPQILEETLDKLWSMKEKKRIAALEEKISKTPSTGAGSSSFSSALESGGADNDDEDDDEDGASSIDSLTVDALPGLIAAVAEETPLAGRKKRKREDDLTEKSRKPEWRPKEWYAFCFLGPPAGDSCLDDLRLVHVPYTSDNKPQGRKEQRAKQQEENRGRGGADNSVAERMLIQGDKKLKAEILTTLVNRGTEEQSAQALEGLQKLLTELN